MLARDPLIDGWFRRTLSDEDVVRRETLEETNSGGDFWSVLAASRPVLHRDVDSARLADAPLCCRERVADPGLHQARQFHRSRHDHSGRRLDRKTSIRALICPRRHDWSHRSRERRSADGVVLVCSCVVHG